MCSAGSEIGQGREGGPSELDAISDQNLSRSDDGSLVHLDNALEENWGTKGIAWYQLQDERSKEEKHRRAGERLMDEEMALSGQE